MFFAGAACAAGPRFDLYFVAIGSDNYVQPASASHFSSLQNAADRSGQRVAELLRSGARFGVTLVSDDKHYVSRADMLRALNRVHAEIARVHPARPLLVFYFAGHGISEGIGWNHFSIPGNFASGKDIPALGIDDLTGTTLHAAELVDTLKSFKLPFVLLLDTCSEGKKEDFRSSVLSGGAQQTLRDTATILRTINEFRDSYPVLFSAEPGTVATTVADPRDPEFYSLGPLGRRLTLIFDKANQSHAPLSLERLLSDMTSSALDPATKPAICHMQKRAFDQLLFDPATPASGTIERQAATAAQAEICCSVKPAAVAPAASHGATGTLQLEGKNGEFVTGGQLYRFVSPPAKFQIVELGEGRLAMEIDDLPGSPWLASFDTGDGSRFAARSYVNAQRFDFGDKGRPGLEISGNGHACNSVGGSFNVSSVDYRASDTLSRLKLSFGQLCGDVKTPLTGVLDVQTTK